MREMTNDFKECDKSIHCWQCIYFPNVEYKFPDFEPRRGDYIDKKCGIGNYIYQQRISNPVTGKQCHAYSCNKFLKFR